MTAAGTTNVFDVNSSGVTADNINLDVDQNGTSIDETIVTDVATGTTVTASDDFAIAVTVTGDDDAAVTVNGAAATITADSSGALTGATITNSLSGASTLVTDSDAAAVLTTTGGDMTITAAAATSVTATSSGSIDANTTDIGAATSVNLTATDEIDVGLDAATSATLSAGGETASTVEDDNTDDTLTTLTLSGNGTAHTFDVRDPGGVNNVTVTGTQDVTVGFDLSDVAALTTAGNDLTFTDSSTGTSTVILDTANAGSATDLSGVAADVINLGVANNQVLTFASAAAVTVSADQAAGTYDGADATAATNTLAITLDDGVDDGLAVDLTSVTLTDLASVTIDASVDTVASTITSLTASADDTDVTIEAGENGVTLATAVDLGTGDLVINSTGAVAGGTTAITANSLTATESGAVTLEEIDATELATVTTGSGSDALTITNTGASLTLDAGDGTNVVSLGANTTNSMTYTLTGGSGFDTLRLADTNLPLNPTAGIYTAGTIAASGFERVGLVADATVAGTQVSVANSLLDGQSYIMTTTGAAEVNTVTVVLGTGEVSSDLSSLTFDNTFQAVNDIFEIDQNGSTANLTLTGSNMINTFTTGTGDDVLTGGDAADVFVAGAGDNTVSGGDGGDDITASGGDDTIDGGAGDDTIDGGAGDDVITAGEGADGITIGTGADTVILTEDTSAVDTVFIATVLDGSADGVGAGTFTDFNTVIGFEAGDDVVTFDSNVFTGDVTDVAGSDANVALNDLDASNYTNVDQVVNFISDLIAGNNYAAVGDVNNSNAQVLDVLTVTLGSGLTAMYAIDDADDAIDATEINLIGTVDTAIITSDVNIV